MGRLGESLVELAVKTETLALTRIAAIFSWKVLLCSDPTRMVQVSMLKCHPWIGMLTHTVLEDL